MTLTIRYEVKGPEPSHDRHSVEIISGNSCDTAVSRCPPQLGGFRPSAVIKQTTLLAALGTLRECVYHIGRKEHVVDHSCTPKSFEEASTDGLLIGSLESRQNEQIILNDQARKMDLESPLVVSLEREWLMLRNLV